MKRSTYHFSGSSTDYYFEGNIKGLPELADPKQTVVVTDENIFSHHAKKLRGWNTIVLKAGEAYKTQATVDSVIARLIGMQANRKTTLVGMGGGVITDIAGYVASVYMRGIAFGFVPTSLLGIVDASIGGKNGVDVGLHKNMVGTIRQPSFILHDLSLLKTLPQSEWENGFAEIIKHACIKDAAMFKSLEANTLKKYQRDKKLLNDLVKRNALIKIKTVQEDEFETGNRKLLNFGHTLGHALENQYSLSHGHAVAIGMAYAAVISEKLLSFSDTGRLKRVLEQYQLPAHFEFDRQKTFDLLQMDKKRAAGYINYVLLKKIGKGIVHPIPLQELQVLINEL